jgi:predicted small secreted protein
VKWNKFLFGVGLGFLGGILLTTQAKGEEISAEKALSEAKQAFKKRGPIEGSWIHMTPETFQKNELSYKVYRGGLTQNEDGELKQLEFIVDAHSGTVLDVTSLN